MTERTVLFELPSVIAGQLVCIEGTVQGRSFPLSAGTFVIGREPGTDLYLPNEPGVSKKHAKIVAEGDHYMLIDMESRNGTIVNGQPVQRKRLFDGDELRVCGCVLRFSSSSPSGATQVAPGNAQTFDEDGETNPESANLAGQAPDMTLAPAGPSESAPPSPPVSAPPTAEWRPPDGMGGPHVSADAVEPIIEERQKSAFPFFLAGLVTVFLVGGGGWVGLRMLAAEGVAPVPGDDGTVTGNQDGTGGDDGAAPVGRPASDAGAAAGAAVGDGDAGAAADEAASGDAGAADPVTDEPDDDDPDDVVAQAGGGADETAVNDEPKPRPKPKPKPKPKPTPTTSGPTPWFDVSADRPTPVSVEMRARGTVAKVAVKDGDAVKRGQLLVELAGSGGADPDEIAELEDSIASLEVIAESQPSAKEMLAEEKRKLAKLKSAGRGARLSAPASGTVNKLVVAQGQSVSPGDSVCEIVRSGGTKLTATVSRAAGPRFKKGASVELELDGGGKASGKVASSKKRGGGYLVVIDPQGTSPDNVARVRVK